MEQTTFTWYTFSERTPPWNSRFLIASRKSYGGVSFNICNNKADGRIYKDEYPYNCLPAPNEDDEWALIVIPEGPKVVFRDVVEWHQVTPTYPPVGKRYHIRDQYNIFGYAERISQEYFALEYSEKDKKNIQLRDATSVLVAVTKERKDYGNS